MSGSYIDRSHDEEIIDVVNNILSNGDFKVETANESILVELMKNRGTPIKVASCLRDTATDFSEWKNRSASK